MFSESTIVGVIVFDRHIESSSELLEGNFCFLDGLACVGAMQVDVVEVGEVVDKDRSVFVSLGGKDAGLLGNKSVDWGLQHVDRNAVTRGLGMPRRTVSGVPFGSPTAPSGFTINTGGTFGNAAFGKAFGEDTVFCQKDKMLEGAVPQLIVPL